MRTLTAHRQPPTAAGRLIWSTVGVATVIGLAIPITFLIAKAGTSNNEQLFQVIPTRMVTITQPVTSLSVESYGAPIQVTAGHVHRVTVTEAIDYVGKDSTAPAVTSTVAAGRLTLSAPACADSSCDVGFTVTVPSGVSVTADSETGDITVSGAAGATLDSGGGAVSAVGIAGQLNVSAEGGNVTVSGSAGANLDSGGGTVSATHIDGRLSVATAGGDLTVNGLTGELDASTDGGQALGSGIAAAAATLTTNGGPARLTFTSAPSNVLVSTGGGDAWLMFTRAPTAVVVATAGGGAALYVPTGPYLVTAESNGGPQRVALSPSPGAHRLINVTTWGGTLSVEPPSQAGVEPPAG